MVREGTVAKVVREAEVEEMEEVWAVHWGLEASWAKAVERKAVVVWEVWVDSLEAEDWATAKEDCMVVEEVVVTKAEKMVAEGREDTMAEGKEGGVQAKEMVGCWVEIGGWEVATAATAESVEVEKVEARVGDMEGVVESVRVVGTEVKKEEVERAKEAPEGTEVNYLWHIF